MSPSLKYLMVSSIAARNASSDPMSLTATLGVELACGFVMLWVGSGCGQDCWKRRRPCTQDDQIRRTIPGDQDGTHEDTAQRSAYESNATGSIGSGFNVVSAAAAAARRRPASVGGFGPAAA